MRKTIYEVVLRVPTEAEPAGRVVDIQEMGTAELLTAFKQTQGLNSDAGANLDTKLAALRLCVVGVDGKPVTYTDLQGSLWDNIFSLKETLQLVQVWGKIHEPGEAEAGLGGMMRVKSGG